MDIFTKKFTPPSGFSDDNLTIFFTNDSFYEADYEAVMNSKHILRIWSQSTWPEDSFTPKENKEDLQHHIDDNNSHSAYGYMIFTKDQKKCLGSIYVNQLRPVADNYSVTNEEKAALTEQFDARIDYWTIVGCEETVLKSLLKWLKEDWKINPLLASRNGLNERQEVYNSFGIQRQFDLKSKTSDMTLLLYLPFSNK